MRRLLHPNLADLAKITDPDSSRFAFGGVRVECGDEKYVAVATDCRMLAHVEGDYVESALMVAEQRERGAIAAIVPAKTWKQIFSSVPRTGLPKAVEVSPGEHRTSFAIATETSEDVRTVNNLEGRFPKYGDHLAPTEPIIATIRLNATMLLDILSVAKKFATDPEDPCVQLEIRGNEKAMLIRASNEEQRFIGVIMPVCTEAEAQGTPHAPHKRPKRRTAKKRAAK